ncbi:helix-turn-helix domain-containing protein [bacterium]|nr:helix-turn-helix domain-containing protein [bacterium]
MLNIGQTLKRNRLLLGISQLEVARRSHISLATIQNIEADKGNPSWETLSVLLQVLGLKIQIQTLLPNWSKLIALGCPLYDEKDSASFPQQPNAELLIETLQNTNFKNFENQMTDRDTQSLISWFSALHDHYPSLWRQASPETKNWFLKNRSLISIKLRRLALRKMDYL